MIQSLHHKIQHFLSVAKKWTESTTLDATDPKHYGKWRNDYFDDHETRTHFKVNSHQLDIHDSKIKSNPQYPKLTPNICLLNMNHDVDITANLGSRFHTDMKLPTYRQLPHPSSSLRFYFS